MSVAYGISCTYNQNGNLRPALQYLIHTSGKRKDALVIGCAHPCRTGLAANYLTSAEVESFLESSVKQMVFHCLFDLVYASNKVLNQVLTFKVEKDSNLYDAVKAFCTIHNTTRKALFGLINMSVSTSVATRAMINAKISAAKTGKTAGNRQTVTTGGCKSRTVKKGKECPLEGCTTSARTGGVCGKHGEKGKECSVEGCTTGARIGGVCGKHGKE